MSTRTHLRGGKVKYKTISLFGKRDIVLDPETIKLLNGAGLEIYGCLIRPYRHISLTDPQDCFNQGAYVTRKCGNCGVNNSSITVPIDLSWQQVEEAICSPASYCDPCMSVSKEAIETLREYIAKCEARKVYIESVFVSEGFDEPVEYVRGFPRDYTAIHPRMVIDEDYFWLPDWLNQAVDADALAKINILARKLGCKTIFKEGFVVLSPIPTWRRLQFEGFRTDIRLDEAIDKLEAYENHLAAINTHKARHSEPAIIS